MSSNLHLEHDTDWFSDFIQDLLINICTFLDLESLHSFQLSSKQIGIITNLPASYHSQTLPIVINNKCITSHKKIPIFLLRYSFSKEISFEIAPHLLISVNIIDIIMHVMKQLETHFHRLNRILIYGRYMYRLIFTVRPSWSVLHNIDSLLLEDCAYINNNIDQRMYNSWKQVSLKDLSLIGNCSLDELNVEERNTLKHILNTLRSLTLTCDVLDPLFLPMLLNSRLEELYLYWNARKFLEFDVIANIPRLSVLHTLILHIDITPRTNIKLLLCVIEQLIVCDTLKYLKIFWMSVEQMSEEQEMLLLRIHNILSSRCNNLKQFAFIPNIREYADLKRIYLMYEQNVKYYTNIPCVVFEVEALTDLFKNITDHQEMNEAKTLVKSIIDLLLLRCKQHQIHLVCGKWLKNILGDIVDGYKNK